MSYPQYHHPTVRRKVLGTFWAGVYEMLLTMGVFGTLQNLPSHAYNTLIVGHGHLPDLSHIDFEDEFTADAQWTDIFIYLVEIDAVEEGAILAFFSDLNPEGTESTICY